MKKLSEFSFQMISAISQISQQLTDRDELVFNVNFDNNNFRLYVTESEEYILFINNCRSKAKIILYLYFHNNTIIRELYEVETDQGSFLHFIADREFNLTKSPDYKQRLLTMGFLTYYEFPDFCEITSRTSEIIQTV